MSVHRICVKDVDTATPDESAWVAAGRMHDRAVGSLIIVDPQQRPVGVVTDRDLVERVMMLDRVPRDVEIAEVMTPDPVVAQSNTSIETAIELMREGGFRRLPLVDDDYRLCGLITLDNVLMYLCEEVWQIGQIIRQKTPEAIVAQSV